MQRLRSRSLLESPIVLMALILRARLSAVGRRTGGSRFDNRILPIIFLTRRSYLSASIIVADESIVSDLFVTCVGHLHGAC